MVSRNCETLWFITVLFDVLSILHNYLNEFAFVYVFIKKVDILIKCGIKCESVCFVHSISVSTLLLYFNVVYRIKRFF